MNSLLVVVTMFLVSLGTVFITNYLAGGRGKSGLPSWLVAAVGVGLALAVLVVIGTLPSYLKERRIRAARTGLTVEDFVGYFSAGGIPEALSLEVYRYLQRLVNVRKFPVLPSDSLGELYGIGVSGGVPLVEAADDLVKLSRCREPTKDEWRDAPVPRTVEDLVRWLSQFYPA